MNSAPDSPCRISVVPAGTVTRSLTRAMKPTSCGDSDRNSGTPCRARTSGDTVTTSTLARSFGRRGCSNRQNAWVPGAAEANDEERRRRSRREFIRVHHPDRGGDPESFRLGLDAFDAVPPAAPAGIPLAEALARRAGRWLAELRRLPRDMRDAYREGRG